MKKNLSPLLSMFRCITAIGFILAFIVHSAFAQSPCTGNVPIENLANGMDYTITVGANGDVEVNLTVLDNPDGLVGFLGGSGGTFQAAGPGGTFTYVLTGQSDPYVLDMFFNWAAGGAGNSEQVTCASAGPEVCMGNVPIENLANGMDYTITIGANGDVEVNLTVVDNPAGLVGFLGGPGGIFQIAGPGGTFTYNLTGQTSPYVLDMFFNWAAGGQGNSETVTCGSAGPDVCMGNVPIENLANGMDYSITVGAGGNVSITVTVVDNPAGLVGFLGGPGGIFQIAGPGGTFTYNLTGQTSPYELDMFFNWAAGGAGNSETVTCPEATVTEVVFCVDLSCFPEAPSNPAVFGNFTTPPFDVNQNLLTDQGGGIWCATVTLEPGTYEYLFFDQNQGPEDFDEGSPCTVSSFGFTNRTLVVGTTSPQMETFGWESCGTDCVTPLLPPDLPITFEDEETIDYALADFAGTSSIIAVDPTDPDNKVVCTTRAQGAAFFAGTVVADNGLANPIPFTETEQKLSVRVWSPTANTPVLLKIENSNGGPTAEVVAFTTVAMQWETLVFDFSNSTNQPFNLANTYDKIVIFFNFEPGVTPGDPVQETALYYWDDVSICVNSCPPDFTVSCLSDTDPITSLGDYLAAGGSLSDGCFLEPDIEITNTDAIESTVCPGTPELQITRTYTATTSAGVTSDCNQIITVLNNFEEPTIAVVPNLTVDCFESINPNPNLADVTTGCENEIDFEVTVTDPILGFGNNCPGETYSVTYTITDACGRTDNAIQTYTIQNEGPAIECPDNCEVLSCYDGDYNAVIEAWLNTVTASSSCSMGLTVSNDYNGVDGICVGDFTPVNFSATDACGRTATCESLIYIIDTDAPDIIGEPSELLVPCTGVTEDIFADWLATRGGVEAYDACYEDDITWSTNPANPMAMLDCSNGPQAIIVEFIVTDGCGNSSSVMGTFNTKLLPNAVNVAGLIQTEAAEPVAAVQVAAYQSSGMTEVNVSNNEGDYSFEELPYEEDTEIVPNKNDDYLNGVTTYDLILLQQYILGIEDLDSPYKKIAADANRSGTISTLDLVLLRRLILHIDEELADNSSWRFVDADYVFPNPENPFSVEFPEAYNLIGEEEEWASFVAVKIGDLNLDAETSNLSGDVDDRSGLNELIFEIEDQKLETGEEYRVEVNAQNFSAIRGFQMTLDFDHSLISILDIERGNLPKFNEANYNLAFANTGTIPMSWNDQEGQDLSLEDAVFSVVIKANADVQLSEVMAITSNMTKAEAYNESELMNVALSFTNNGQSVATDQFQLFQNQPNPFKAATVIGFQLPEAGEVTLEIYTVSGKLLRSDTKTFAKGFNQFDVNASELPSGVLYYHVHTAMNSASKKMILLK